MLDPETVGTDIPFAAARPKSAHGEYVMNTARLAAVAAIATCLAAGAAQAQIKIGAILSISGPGAGMGVGYKGAFDFFPTEIAGQKVEYIVRDDATDANTGFTIAQKMISEDHVDAIIGPSLTATDAAVAPLANQAHVPMIAMAPYEYDAAKQPYTFNDAQPLSLMVGAVFKYMQAHGRQRHRLYRLLRRLGRSGAGQHQGRREGRRHQDPRRRTLCAHRYLGRGAGAQADEPRIRRR